MSRSSTPLQTPRLHLRPYLAGDWPPFGALLMDAEVQKFVEGPKTMRAARQLFARLLAETGPPRALGAWEATSARYLGHGWVTADRRQPELGYIVASDRRGQGLATELASAVLLYAHEVLGLDELWASIDEDNAASLRVAEKLGFTRVDWVDDGHGTPYFSYRLSRARPAA